MYHVDRGRRRDNKRMQHSLWEKYLLDYACLMPTKCGSTENPGVLMAVTRLREHAKLAVISAFSAVRGRGLWEPSVYPVTHLGVLNPLGCTLLLQLTLGYIPYLPVAAGIPSSPSLVMLFTVFHLRPLSGCIFCSFTAAVTACN